ncbi:unnamed protein product [Prorocentrum cordatum]|uniref:Uncharacterized protein n=1 Tax=Prorocentrum cordatum TaxID=2364126 RepID=A0ABN9VZ39_9DINO|nr:unnamed protein product [Polarella glacialis]
MSLPATFVELQTTYRFDEAIAKFLTDPEPAGLGLETMDDFAALFTSETEVQNVLNRIESVRESSRQLSRLRQAWRGVKNLLSEQLATARKGTDNDDLDKFLDQPTLDDLAKVFWKRYRNSWPPDVMPSDQMISRIYRELAARLLSVRDAWKTKCLADQLRSSRKCIPLPEGAELKLPEDKGEERGAHNYKAYMSLLWTLLLAYAMVGAWPRDPPPGSRPVAEDPVDDSVLFVECPLDVLESYWRRADRNARKVP